MAKSLLLVTADNNFGQVLLYGLEQAGYHAFIVKGKGEAVVRADEKLTAFVELEREVLTVTFYLESIKPET